jgi:hypothetical protein
MALHQLLLLARPSIPASSFTNLVTNPSFERLDTSVTTNLVTNPSFETNRTDWFNFSNTTSTRITTDSLYGNACLEISTTALNAGVRHDVVIEPNKTYVMSGWFKATAGTQYYVALNERTSANVSVGSTSGPGRVASGGWQRLSISRAMGATAGIARLQFLANQSANATFLIDGIMLTEGSAVETYFDGNTTGVNDTTYAWSGTSNNSSSTETKPSIATYRTNLIANTSFEFVTTGYSGTNATLSLTTTEAYAGSQSLLATISSASGANTQFIDHTTRVSTTVGINYTASVYVYLPSTNTADSQLQLQLLPWTGSSFLTTISGDIVTVTKGQWTRLSVSGTAPTGSTALQMRLLSVDGLAVGQEILMDAVLFETGSVLSTFFDGNTLPSGDFVYRWSGNVMVSTANQRVRQIANFDTSNNAVSALSRQWSSSGVRSLLVSTTSSSLNNSSTRFRYTGLTIGQTYTALVKCRLEAPQTGSLNTSARSVSAWNDALTTRIAIAQAPNEAGIHDLRLVFTATATAHQILLYNGAFKLNGDVWFDDFLLVEGNYEDEYFDGSSTPTDPLVTYAWTGTENNSTSTRDREFEY